MLKTEWYNVFDRGFEDGAAFRHRMLSDEPEAADAEAMHIVLYDDDKTVGYGRVCLADGDFLIDRLCVHEDFRGIGYGDFMLRLIIRRLFLSGAETYYAISSERSVNLFLRLGFEENGRVAYKGVEYIKLVRSGDVSSACL